MANEAEKQRLYDRANQEYAQAKGHNQRVKERYPEAWATSTITNAVLTEWILEHKGTKCRYCDRLAIEIDHKIPLSREGGHSLDNLQMLCLPCNRAKHDLSDDEFRKLKEEGGIPEPEPEKSHRVSEITLENLEQVRISYLEIGDPTEYKAARDILGGVDRWVAALGQEPLQEAILGWRAELRAKLRSEAVGRLISIALGTSSQAGAAIKSLVSDDFLYVPFVGMEEAQNKRPVGRPANVPFVEIIPKEIVEDDARRIGFPSRTDQAGS